MPSKFELAVTLSKASGLIDIFDIHTKVHLKHIVGNFSNICILHDSLLICCDNDKNILSVYNYRYNRIKWKCTIPKETKLGPICVSSTSPFSSSSKTTPCDARFIFIGTASGYIYCWCLLTGKLLNTFKAHLQSITVLTMSQDCNLLISGSDDCLIKVWKLSSIITQNTTKQTPKEYIIWKDHILGITDIYCSNNQRIFTSSRDCTVKIYSLLNKELISSISFPNLITSIRIDPANIYLLVASNIGQLWRINLINNPKFKPNADIQHIEQQDPNTILSDVTYS